MIREGGIVTLSAAKKTLEGPHSLQQSAFGEKEIWSDENKVHKYFVTSGQQHNTRHTCKVREKEEDKKGRNDGVVPGRSARGKNTVKEKY